MKKLIYISIFLFFSTSISALTSSSFLISQLAFKNYDYPTSLSDLKINENNFSNSKLLDKIIAAVIVEDLSTANELSSQLMTKDKDNQEAYIVKLTYLYINKKFNKIKKFFPNKYSPYIIGEITEGKSKVLLNGKINW